MPEYSTSRLADGRLVAAIAQLNRDAADSRRLREEMRAQEEMERRRVLERLGELDGRVNLDRTDAESDGETAGGLLAALGMGRTFRGVR